MEEIYYTADGKQVLKAEWLKSVGLDGYEDFLKELQSKVEKDHHIDHLYLIQLFDYNCPSCTSGVTKVFVEDIDEFANHYQRIEKDQKRIERFLKSKDGEIITDYYSDDPKLNIVQKVDVQDMGWMMAWKRDIKLSIPNGYDWESDYFFKLLALEIRFIKYKDNYYKLVKPIARDCCTDSMFDDERPYRKISIYGNPFWIYEEKSEIPRALVSLEEARGITLESYVWQVADIFDTEEELKEDVKKVWPTEEQINRIFADIPGDAG